MEQQQQQQQRRTRIHHRILHGIEILSDPLQRDEEDKYKLSIYGEWR
jgi:hypothetical protein